MFLTTPKSARLRAPSGVSAGGWNAPQLRIVTFDQPISGPDDPRWVLAVRASEMLDGPILRPERREGLIRLGRTLGLSLFDANLVIAIVQDQARRGRPPEECPATSEPRLRMIPVTEARRHQMLYVACAIAGLLAVELLVLAWAVG